MNKLDKAKIFVFTTVIIIAALSYIFHALPYRAAWLWFPILVLVNQWMDSYAKKRGLILEDEMTRQRTGTASWMTFQATIALLFISIVYYDINRTVMDPRLVFAYLAGYMGIVYILVYVYYNIKQGIWG